MSPPPTPQTILSPPKTIDQAVNYLLNALTQEDLDSIRNTPKDDLVFLHFPLGMRIRNTFGLWRENTELLLSCGSLHPDDASMVLLEALWEKVREGT